MITSATITNASGKALLKQHYQNLLPVSGFMTDAITLVGVHGLLAFCEPRV